MVHEHLKQLYPYNQERGNKCALYRCLCLCEAGYSQPSANPLFKCHLHVRIDNVEDNKKYYMSLYK